jgi:hypothetical protein
MGWDWLEKLGFFAAAIVATYAVGLAEAFGVTNRIGPFLSDLVHADRFKFLIAYILGTAAWAIIVIVAVSWQTLVAMYVALGFFTMSYIVIYGVAMGQGKGEKPLFKVLCAMVAGILWWPYHGAKILDLNGRYRELQHLDYERW